MPNIQDNYQGVINVQVTEDDVVFGGNMVLPTPRLTFQTLKHQYSQKLVAYNSCTIHGAAGCITDLTGYVYSTDEIKVLWDKALTLGASNDVGWTLRGAAQLLVDDWNAKNPNDQLMILALQTGSPEYNNAIGLGFSIQIGYSGNGAYNTDAHDDNTLEKTSFGAPTYSHCIRDTNNDLQDLLFVDNYPEDQAPNTYKVPKANLMALKTNGVVFGGAYLFVYKNDFNAMNTPSSIPLWMKAAVDIAVQKGVIATEGEALATLNVDPHIEDLLFNTGIITQKSQPWTVGRFCVVLQRLGKL